MGEHTVTGQAAPQKPVCSGVVQAFLKSLKKLSMLKEVLEENEA